MSTEKFKIWTEKNFSLYNLQVNLSYFFLLNQIIKNILLFLFLFFSSPILFPMLLCKWNVQAFYLFLSCCFVFVFVLVCFQLQVREQWIVCLLPLRKSHQCGPIIWSQGCWHGMTQLGSFTLTSKLHYTAMRCGAVRCGACFLIVQSRGTDSPRFLNTLCPTENLPNFFNSHTLCKTYLLLIL